MNATSTITVQLQHILTQPAGAITGLVDDLLLLCREHRLQLDWNADGCRVRSSAGNGAEVVAIPVRKSVFRAILARLAVLCNERQPNAVSAYGGQGEIVVAGCVFQVFFTNTTAEQTLQLLPREQAVS
jgi:hypothetical protein